MKTRMMIVLAVVCAGLCHAGREQVRLASVPTLSPDGKKLVFEYRRDLWIASSGGGEARPLTTHPAYDTRPVFSPDGKRIAFGSNRDDSWQVFVVPVSGGAPRQLTFHSEGATPRAWFPDGKSLLVLGDRAHQGHRQARLLRVNVEGKGEPTMLFNAFASEAAISPQGNQLLFTTGGERLYRKGYKGSFARKIWLRDLEAGEQKPILDLDTSCRTPMWKPDESGFYYVGQQDGCYNIRVHDLESGEDEALTTFKDDAVILPSLSANGKMMVFRNLFDLYSINPTKPDSLKKLKLWIETDSPVVKTRRRSYDKAWNNDEWGSLSSTDDGLEFCFTAGGDLWVMDTVLREPVAVCGDATTHERQGVFSKDAKRIFFLRDDGVGVNIWKAERSDESLFWWENETFKLTPVTQDRIARARLSISPDGKRLAVAQGAGELWTMNTDGSERRKLADSPFDVYYDWSPDGKWLACDICDSWGNRDIWIVDEAGKRDAYNLSRHPNWDGNPRWSPDGKVVAYVGKRFDDEVDIYYVWLSREDEIKNKRQRKRDDARKKIEESRNGDKNKEKKKEESVSVGIDFDGLSRRVHRVDIGGVPSSLFWSFDSKALAFQSRIDGKDGTWKIQFPDPKKPAFMTETKGSYARWIKKDSKIMWLAGGVPAAYTQKYSFMLYNEVDIPAYRRLAFRMMWREFRDRFYDPALNNRDWEAVRRKYEDQAAISDWDDFERIGEMLMGELNASHLSFEQTDASKKEWNPDYHPRQGWVQRTAALGLEFSCDHAGNGLKVSHVVRNGAADRHEEPVRVGETLLEIDGTKVGKSTALSPLLNGYYPRDIKLSLAGTNGTRRIISVEEEGFGELRKRVREEWMDYNRRMVAKQSGGRCGYLNIERMNFANLRQFEKEIYACGFGKDGLVIDVRNNPGGFISDHLISILCHPRHAVTIPRNGEAGYQQGYLPSAAWFKPIVVLCNEYSSSNSEIFCHAIQTLKRGKIVGVPTQRAVISTSIKKILDVGQIRMPHRGWFRLEDGADMEQQPCVPDVLLANDPEDVPAGRDPQLKRAVEELLKDIKAGEGQAEPKPVYASEQR